MTRVILLFFFFFFFNDTATTEIYTPLYTLSLHDALPICARAAGGKPGPAPARGPGKPGSARPRWRGRPPDPPPGPPRSGIGRRSPVRRPSAWWSAGPAGRCRRGWSAANPAAPPAGGPRPDRGAGAPRLRGRWRVPPHRAGSAGRPVAPRWPPRRRIVRSPP